MNIWEVVTINDLIKIIKENPQKFVILALVLNSTPKSLQVYIKKFLKQKAKVFPNMTFLYHKVSSKDLGKISLLDKNINQYPLMYHIYDVNNIFIKITNAVQETIVEAFSKGEEYYKTNLLKLSTPEKTNSSITINKVNKVNKVNNNQIDNNQEDNNAEQDTSSWDKQQQIMAEQQKLIEKVITLQNKEKEYNLEILKDLKERKKEEERIKKK